MVNVNEEWRKLFRQELGALREQRFDQMSEADQISVLTKYIDQPGDDPKVRFFRAVKGMTADGYYTSKMGLVDDLGFRGNTVHESFPSCEVPEH